jgi:hypothetical protein
VKKQRPFTNGGRNMNAYNKARSRRVLLTVAGVALTWALLSGDTSVAQTTPTLSFVTSGEEPLAVELENEEAGLLGTVDSVLLNNSDYEGPLTVEFIARDTGEVTSLGTDPEFPEDRLAFFTPGSAQPSVESFITMPIRLRFGADKTYMQQPTEGVIVARAADGRAVRPATLQVRIMPPEVISRWEEARIEPANVTIVATRWWPTPLRGWLPLSSFNREARVWIRDVGSGANVATGETIVSTRLSSDTGGTSSLVLVTQADLPDQEQSEVEAVLRVADISRAGTYAGDLALEPAVEDSPKVTVALKARDFFLWPLITLLGGAGVAWWLIKRRDQGRPKKILLSELGKAFEQYTKARLADPECTYRLNHVFPENGGWRSCEGLSDKSPKAQTAYCDISKAKTKEQLDEVIAKVRDIQELVALWPEVRRSAKELEGALKDLPEDVPLRRETMKMLKEKDLPTETKAMKDLLELYRRQTQAVKMWKQGKQLADLVSPLYAALLNRNMPEIDKAQLNDNDPDTLRRTYLEPAVSLDDLTKQNVIPRLRESIYVLMALDRAYPTDVPALAEDSAATEAARAASDAARAKADAALKRAVLPSTIRQPSDGAQSLARALLTYVSPEEIISMVRVHDRWDFVVTAGLTMLAYLVTQYVSTSFGSIWQYLTAFLVGATGQLVINWALLPWYRSYKIASSTPAKPATGGT